MALAGAPSIATAGSFQTSIFTSTLTDQPLIQFNPGPATTPSITWTYFFTYLTGILKLNQYLATSGFNVAGFDIFSPYCSDILINIAKGVKEKFYSQPSWSSSIQNSPGWAADNSVNAYNAQLNVAYNGKLYGKESDSSSLICALYYLVHALNVEAHHKDIQTNRYLYDFIVSTEITAYDFSNSLQTHKVDTWIEIIDSQLIGLIPDTLKGYPNLFDSIVAQIEINSSSALDFIDRINPAFKATSVSTSDPSGTAYGGKSLQNIYQLTGLVTTLGYAYNALTMQAAGYLKWRIATDGSLAVFDKPSDHVSAALEIVEPLVNDVSAFIVSDFPKNNPLSSPQFWEAISATSVSARQGQVDGNRIPGVAIPNLIVIQQRLASAKAFAVEVSTQLEFVTNEYSTYFINAVQNLIANVDSAIVELQKAIDNFYDNHQNDIHTARWQAYLTVN